MSAAGQLGAVEARRMVRHPVYLVAVAYLGSLAVESVYTVVLLDALLVYAPATLIAANRVTAAPYRRRVREPFDVVPVGGRQRALAAILGLLRGPVVAGLGVAAVLLVLDPRSRGPIEYLQLPALVLGAGLLGIAVARWLPWPGALPVVAILLWLAFLLLFQFTDTGVAPERTWFALWPVWMAGTYGLLPRQPQLQEMWHLAYLLGLGGLAGVAALLRTEGPRRALWFAAAATGALTLLAAWQQLGR